jgi:hypothetical protein
MSEVGTVYSADCRPSSETVCTAQIRLFMRSNSVYSTLALNSLFLKSHYLVLGATLDAGANWNT